MAASQIGRYQQEARADPDGFWSRAASALPWLRKWDRVFEAAYPTFKWFVGGQTNLAYSALDAHVRDGRRGRVALIYLNERGERKDLTYRQLLAEVERVAAALRGLGIQKGDRITVYMPLCPETIALLLATVRIGAIHSVVFAGFGAGAPWTGSAPADRGPSSPPTPRSAKGRRFGSKRSSTPRSRTTQAPSSMSSSSGVPPNPCR